MFKNKNHKLLWHYTKFVQIKIVLSGLKFSCVSNLLGKSNKFFFSKTATDTRSEQLCDFSSRTIETNFREDLSFCRSVFSDSYFIYFD